MQASGLQRHPPVDGVLDLAADDARPPAVPRAASGQSLPLDLLLDDP
jgi:hypothetical protein